MSCLILFLNRIFHFSEVAGNYVGGSNSDAKLWVGVRYSQNEWKNIDDNLKTNFSDWKYGEPANVTENNGCVTIDTQGWWYNEDCSQSYPFVCGVPEIIETSTSNPSTATRTSSLSNATPISSPSTTTSISSLSTAELATSNTSPTPSLSNGTTTSSSTRIARTTSGTVSPPISTSTVSSNTVTALSRSSESTTRASTKSPYSLSTENPSPTMSIETSSTETTTIYFETTSSISIFDPSSTSCRITQESILYLAFCFIFLNAIQ